MKNKLIFAALALLLVAGLAWAFWPSPPEVEVASVTRGRFERAVQEDGKTRVRERYIVSGTVAGHLSRIQLVQGDSVARGAAVATISPLAPALLDARSQAEQAARVGAAEAGVAQAQARVAAASVALAQSQQDGLRNAALVRQGFVSAAQGDTVRLAEQLRTTELQAAQQAQTAARFALEQTRVPLRPLGTAGPAGSRMGVVVTSPVAGKVLKVLQQSEGVVLAGTGLLEVGDPAALEAVVDILTEEAAQVVPDTPVQLLNWGGAGVLQGKVRYVEPAAFTKVSALGVEEQRVNVIVDITTPAATWRGLGDGFKIDVRVLVQVVDDALMVPVSALFPIGSRSGVFVLDGDHVRLREVVVQARNGTHAWVPEGLPLDTRVVVYPDIKLQDGAKVKTRRPG
ncbi:HlyD family efflux transporter periplasmic adaptor subunit [Rhodoferax sp. TBRC 17198]|uniref:efflux RND transporter periplasmic adaptor subunit n=1 Tax=Rhodoferax potami TaxID=3068338 RepID=UPI0028BDBD87|nr:HlyD family efflux transporter periplasmic adaptor subunit [Rhodoferax sp. TBRC 17198]MDT7521536.1 HlyD family efflux transporter periplasmic adaptor subunit [Rhodoferax sp. TBRC 17198]